MGAGAGIVSPAGWCELLRGTVRAAWALHEFDHGRAITVR